MSAIAIESGVSTPSVWLELRGSQMKQLEEIEVGIGVEVVLRGKVIAVSERETDGVYTGSLEVEWSRLKVRPEDNEFGKLVRDDD